MPGAIRGPENLPFAAKFRLSRLSQSSSVTVERFPIALTGLSRTGWSRQLTASIVPALQTVQERRAQKVTPRSDLLKVVGRCTTPAAARALCRTRSIIDWRVDDPDTTGGEVPIDECTFHNSIFPPNRNMPIHVPCRRPDAIEVQPLTGACPSHQRIRGSVSGREGEMQYNATHGSRWHR